MWGIPGEQGHGHKVVNGDGHLKLRDPMNMYTKY